MRAIKGPVCDLTGRDWNTTVEKQISEDRKVEGD